MLKNRICIYWMNISFYFDSVISFLHTKKIVLHRKRLKKITVISDFYRQKEIQSQIFVATLNHTNVKKKFAVIDKIVTPKEITLLGIHLLLQRAPVAVNSLCPPSLRCLSGIWYSTQYQQKKESIFTEQETSQGTPLKSIQDIFCIGYF